MGAGAKVVCRNSAVPFGFLFYKCIHNNCLEIMPLQYLCMCTLIFSAQYAGKHRCPDIFLCSLDVMLFD